MKRTVMGALVALLLLGCDADRIRGERIQFLGFPVALTADTHEDRVSRVMVTLPHEVVRNAPTGATAQPTVGQISFPAKVAAETFADFFEIAWNPQGDPRGILAPNFALRFFDLDAAAVTSLNCQDPSDVPQDRIPVGFNVPPGDAPGGCVPGQGRRATSASASPGGPGSTVVLGFDNGRQVLLEVQLSRDLLLTQHSFVVPFPRPSNLGTWTRFPTQLVANFRTDLNAWELTLDELEQVNQATSP